MSWSEAIDKVNRQLEKAREFRYFALLATFVFFLDFSLIAFHGHSISQLSYSNIGTNYPLGHVLLFFTLFAFFMSFVVPLVHFILRIVSMMLPAEVLLFFHNDQWKDIEPSDYFYLYQLERYAIKNENPIAYDYYKSLVSERVKDRQLEYFCLALSMAVVLDFYAYIKSTSALVSWLIPFFSGNQLTLANSIISLSLWALMLFSLYFGVIRGGGFSLKTKDKVYFPKNEFRDS